MTGYDRQPTDSLGKVLVGFDFNPSGDATVAKLKGLFAEAIDIVQGLPSGSDDATAEEIKLQAIRQCVTAQMWTVKAATWRK